MSLKELCVDSLSKTNKNINYLKNLLGFEKVCEDIETKRKEYLHEYYLLHKPDVTKVLGEYFNEELKLINLKFSSFKVRKSMLPLVKIERIAFEEDIYSGDIIPDYNSDKINLKVVPFSFRYYYSDKKEYYSTNRIAASAKQRYYSSHDIYCKRRFVRKYGELRYNHPGWVEDEDDPNPDAHKYVYPEPYKEDTKISYSLISASSNAKLLCKIEHHKKVFDIRAILEENRNKSWILYLDALILDPIMKHLPLPRVNPYI